MKKQAQVSFIIPTYNGVKLLKKHLSTVVDQLKKGDQLVIVDDASQDSSKNYLIDKFSLKLQAIVGDKYGDYELFHGIVALGNMVKLIVNRKNLRFAASCNRGVNEGDNSLVFLLNNDVEINSKTRDTLVNEFIDRSDLFAVGCLETEPNVNQFGGKNKLWFDKGLFRHSRASNYESGETAWASGGSAMFDRNKWLKLGGFDVKYYPAYWEDIDLSTRAKKYGWKVLFSQKAKVIHAHETTNQTEFGQNIIQQTSWKNADIYTWKHSTLNQKFLFLMFRPYWWIQRLLLSPELAYMLAFFLVILIAFFLRFYRLAQVPAGMTWDEAAVGYNGYSVIKTRRDEWLTRLPISFRSFGDFKAPSGIYLTGIFTTLFGLNLQAVRLPFALSGVLAVLGIMKLTELLLVIHRKNNDGKHQLSNKILGLFAGLILATSPWHLHLSRTGFDCGLALTQIIWGIYFIGSYFVTDHKKIYVKIGKLLLGAVLFATSMYTYHSPKIFVPVFVIIYVLIHHKVLIKKKIEFGIVSFISILLLVPLLRDSLFGEGLARSENIFVLNSDLSLFQILKMIAVRFSAHLSPDFLINGWMDTLRHGPAKYGSFLFFVFVLMLLGLISIINTLFKKKKIEYLSKLSCLWLCLGLLPAILTYEFPQGNRALLALPGYIWLSVIGIEFFYQSLFQKWFKTKLAKVSVAMIIMVVFVINFLLYHHYYYQEFAYNSADEYHEGYIEAMQIAHQYEKGVNDKPEVDEIIISNRYGQPYIFALFVRKTNPIWYQGGSLIKYKFLDKVTINELSLPNRLVIATLYDDMQNADPTHVVYSMGGEPRFRLYYTGQE